MACHVLLNARMTRAILVASLLAAVAATAHADPVGIYAGGGIGSTNVSDDSMRPFSESGRSYRLFVGHKFTPLLGVEGGVMGFSADRSTIGYDGRALYAAGRLNYPLGDNFDVVGRLGATHSWLTPTRGEGTWDGTGYLLSAGFEYHVPASVIAQGSVWVDYTRTGTNFSLSDAVSQDAAVGMWTLGVTVGF